MGTFEFLVKFLFGIIFAVLIYFGTHNPFLAFAALLFWLKNWI